jgi:sucrose phosphorylase
VSEIKPLYPPETVEWLTDEIFSLMKDTLCPSGRENFKKWNHNNVLLITYGDSIVTVSEHP